MRRLVLTTCVLLAAACAHAAESRRYAVLSLVGDHLLIVQRELSTGSRLDRNTRQVVDIPDRSLDKSMLLAVDEAIRRTDPGAPTILLAPRDPSLYAAAQRRLDGSGDVASLFAAVRPVLTGTNATHLVLVTKQRHRAMLRLADGLVGSGYLEGFGFYLDHGTMARGADTNEAERGFIAPFTYVNIALIDAATGRVLSEERIAGSSPYTTTGINIGNAWLALTPQQMAERLAEVMRAESARVVPQLLGHS
jgi:hypothetical protein